MKLDELLSLHKDTCNASRDILIKKNNDYASHNDVFFNLSACSRLGIDPKDGVLIRMMDKIYRLKNKNLMNETVEDTVIDIINYSILFLAMK